MTFLFLWEPTAAPRFVSQEILLLAPASWLVLPLLLIGEKAYLLPGDGNCVIAFGKRCGHRDELRIGALHNEISAARTVRRRMRIHRQGWQVCPGEHQQVHAVAAMTRARRTDLFWNPGGYALRHIAMINGILVECAHDGIHVRLSLGITAGIQLMSGAHDSHRDGRKDSNDGDRKKKFDERKPPVMSQMREHRRSLYQGSRSWRKHEPRSTKNPAPSVGRVRGRMTTEYVLSE